MPVNTKTAPRRSLTFTSIQDIDADLERLQAAHTSGSLTHSGNWPPGAILQHVGDLIRYSYDGFPFKAPAPIRIFGRFIKKSALGAKPIPPGLQLRGGSTVLIPPMDVSFDAGLATLRKQMGRIRAGERMTAPSPIFGPMTHEQWLGLHCKHASLHLSFLDASAQD